MKIKNNKILHSLFLYAPFVWLFIGMSNFPSGPNIQSKVTAISGIFFLVFFRRNLIENLKINYFKEFLLINIIVIVYFTAMHIIFGERFTLARILIISLLFIAFIPWKKIDTSILKYTISLSGTAIGLGSLYQFYYLDMHKVGYLATNPIPYATVAASVLVLNMYMLGNSSEKLIKILSSISIIGSLYTISLSGVRGVWLALLVIGIISIVVYFLRLQSLKNKTILLIFILITVSLVGIVSKNHLLDRISQTEKEYSEIQQKNMDTSIGIRLQLYETGLQYIKENPIFGFGTANFKSQLVQDYKNNKITKAASDIGQGHFHNQYIDTLVRYGILGLLILLIWIITPIILAYKSKNTQWIILGTISLSIAIASLTDVPYHHPYLIYFYIITSSTLLLTSIHSNKVERI